MDLPPLTLRILHIATHDDLVVRHLEVHHLRPGDFTVAELERLEPDVVLVSLDPHAELDGYAIVRRIRARSDVPILTTGVRPDLVECVRALDVGADDHLVRPEVPELLARIRAHVRRARGELIPRPVRVEVGPLVVDLVARSVSVAGAQIELTSSEYAIVRALASRPGRVFSRRQLLQVLHGSDEAAFDRAVDVVVSRTRSKLEADSRHPQLLKTVRGRGYVIAA